MTDKDKEAAYDRGVQDAKRSLRPFLGVPNALFRFDLPEHEAVLLYAKRLDEAMLDLEEGIADAQEARTSCSKEVDQARLLLREALAEISEARAHVSMWRGFLIWLLGQWIPEKRAVDQAVAAYEDAFERLRLLTNEFDLLRRERNAVQEWTESLFETVLDALAAQEEKEKNTHPPSSADVYGSEAAFVFDNPMRQAPGWPDRPVAGGMDFGYRWRRHGDDEAGVPAHQRGRWRVSWIGETGEIYASRQIADRPEVWLLLDSIYEHDEAGELLEPLETEVQQDSNSLLELADRLVNYRALRERPRHDVYREATLRVHQELPLPHRGGNAFLSAVEMAMSVADECGHDAEDLKRLLWDDRND